ncbi:cytochrome P450 [Cryphonectria parasitica EP155]|uniref:Cytochrome P450 n=1 Tax=Cryphonectria parasitica (strain ATCC 38755 / EP155) TaxID=660469 RepID=A0A9P4XV80_CRYP1|nr:cytochrome P450 [Cryphonectria parasitica EP155]KAF3761235.1 cytochrome P450 [Cryphonectria parasitica EP155]
MALTITIIALATAVFGLLTTLIYTKLHFKRFEEYRGIPQLRQSLILGNLKTIYDYTLYGERDRHLDHGFTEMLEALGRPQLMLVDIWPLRSPLLVVGSQEIAEQLCRPTNLFPWGSPKCSMLTAGGKEWLVLRKKNNPAFSHQRVLVSVPTIIDKVEIFIDKLDQHMFTGDEFSLLALCADLALDVIGQVVLGIDLDAQLQRPSKLARDFLELMSTYDGLLTVISQLDEESVDNSLAEHIRQKFKANSTEALRQNHSVLSQRLQDIPALDPLIVAEISDQLKTFLLAGRDTTGITLAWALYELSRTPGALRPVRLEADAVLGPGTDLVTIRTTLGSDRRDLLGRMPFTHAVIRQTLRLHPPGGAMRYSDKHNGLTVCNATTGQTHCLDGLAIYLCEPVIHRDVAVYGDSANVFVPERWAALGAAAKIPPSAWRPFERGPRACIGQELAMLEVCLVLALVCRRYDFVKVGLGRNLLGAKGEEVLDERTGQFKAASEMYKPLQVAAQPLLIL